MVDPYHLIISPEASADLAAIHAFIARESSANAAKMIERLLAAMETLKMAPHRTVLQHQSRKVRYPVRSLPVRPYLIFFRVIDEKQLVRILTIRHGARRRPRRFD